MPTAAEIARKKALVTAIKAAFNGQIGATDSANAQLSVERSPEFAPVIAGAKNTVAALNAYGDTLRAVTLVVNAMVPDDAPVPVDCVLSEWGDWLPVSAWGACVDGTQARVEHRHKTVITPPSNGGAACGVLEETRTVTQDCVVLPPEDDPNVVMLASAYPIYNYRYGPADRAKLSVLKKAIADTPPWTTFCDEFEHIAPSAGGARVTEFVKLHLCGNQNELYHAQPVLLDDNTSFNLYPWGNGDFAAIQAFMPQQHHRGGPRGQNIATPYTTWHSHPRKRADGTISMSKLIPLYMGIIMDGTLCHLHRDGSITELLRIPGVSVTPDFTMYRPNHRWIFVVDSLNGRVLRVDRKPGFIGLGVPEQFEKWETTVLSDKFIKPTSIREAGGELYVVDNGDSTVYHLSQEGVKTKVISIPDAFWVDHDSNEKLVIATLSVGCYKIDQAAPVLGPNLGGNSMKSFVTLSVDRNGTFGKVDEFSVSVVTSINNVSYYRYQDGEFLHMPLGGGAGAASVGNLRWCLEIQHYGWGLEHHEEEGILLALGLAEIAPIVIAVRPDNYAEEDDYNTTAFGWGINVIQFGSLGVPVGTKPSLTCQIHDRGWGFWSADWLAELPFAEQVAFIQGGGVGSFPRPEIRGRDMYHLLYMLCRSSQRFLREGKVFMDALLAYHTPSFGTELPMLPKSFLRTAVDGDLWLSLVPSAGTITMTCFKKPTYSYNALVPPASLVVKVVADEGLPEQVDLGELRAPWTMPVPALTPGQHSLRCVSVTGVGDPGKWFGQASVLNVA